MTPQFRALPRELVEKCLSYVRDASFILGRDIRAYYSHHPHRHRGGEIERDKAVALLHEVRMERVWESHREKRHTEYYERVRGSILWNNTWERSDALLEWYAENRLGWYLASEYQDWGYADMINA
jgi:hypothetical protein